MSDSTKQNDPSGSNANNQPIGHIDDVPRREIFFQRGRRRRGRQERMGFVLGVALQALLPGIALTTGHVQGDAPLEPVVDVMEMDEQAVEARVDPDDQMDTTGGGEPVVRPVEARLEPMEARVEPEDQMDTTGGGEPVVRPVEARLEPMEARVEPEVQMEEVEGQEPVVQPDEEMEEIEEARGQDESVGGLEMEEPEEEAVPAEEPNVAPTTPLRSCLKRSSPEKEDGGSPKRRRVSFSRSVDVQHHQRVLANNLNRPYVMTGEATETGVERLKRPTDREKPQKVTEDEVVELLEASGGPQTLPTVGNPPTHRGCTCGETCDENCSCLLLGIKCSGHFGCLCAPGKCGTGRPTAAANARLYVPGRAVSATAEYDDLEARADSTTSSVDVDNLFDSASGSNSVGSTTMLLNQTTDEDGAGTSNADLDASFVHDEEEQEEQEQEEEQEDFDASMIQPDPSISTVSDKATDGGDDNSDPDLDASFMEVNDQHPSSPTILGPSTSQGLVYDDNDDDDEEEEGQAEAPAVEKNEEVEEEEQESFQDADVSMIHPDSPTSADSDKAIDGDDESDPDSDASFMEVNDQHPTQTVSDSPKASDQVSVQSPPPDIGYEADDSIVVEEEEEKEEEEQQQESGDSATPTLFGQVSSWLGSVFSRSSSPAAAQRVEDDESEEVAEKEEVEDSPIGGAEDVIEADQDAPAAEVDTTVNQFVSIATLDSPSHLVGSVLEEIEADDVMAECGDEEEAEDDEAVPQSPTVAPSNCMDMDSDDGESDAPSQSSPVRVPVGPIAIPASPPGSPSSSSSDSSSSDDESSDDDNNVPELPFDAQPEQFPTRLLRLLPALVDQREINSCLPNAWLGGEALFVGLMKTATEFNEKYAGTGRRCGVVYHNVFVEALDLVERDLAAARNGGRNGRQVAALNELNPATVAQYIVYGNSWSELLIPLNIKNQHWAIAVVKRNAVQGVILDSLAEPTTSPDKELRKEQDEKVKLALKKILVAVGAVDPNDKTTHRFKARHTFRKLRCIQEDDFNCGIFAMVHGRRVLERASFNGATRAGKDAEVDLADEREVLKAALEETKAYFVRLARQNGRLQHGPNGPLPITASKTPVILRWSGKC